ncbi:MAG: hypothetical protein AB7P76_02190 [Candidatus Melainabacteria bacterium]
MSTVSVLSQALIPTLGYAGFATASKAVGSVFRVAADKNAPAEVRSNTVKRESAMLGLVFAFNAAVQMAGRKMNMGPAAKLLATIPTTALAEYASRKVGKNTDWDALLNGPKQAANAVQKISDLKVGDMPFADRIQVLGDIGKHVVASATGRLAPQTAPHSNPTFSAFNSANPFATAQTGYNATVQSPLLGFSGRQTGQA